MTYTPLFDEYGDMIAMSVGYQRKKGRKNVKFFDAYTANKHIKWYTESVHGLRQRMKTSRF